MTIKKVIGLILVVVAWLVIFDNTSALANSNNFYGTQSIKPMVEESETTIYLPGGVKLKTESDKTKYTLTDHLGSIRLAVAGNNSVSMRGADYTPFGNTPANTTETAEAGQYTGMTYEPETATYDYHARAYDPTIARFTSVDAIRQSISPYSYTENNPILYVDPTGKTRTGVVVTPQVKALADEWVGKTSKYDSYTRFLRLMKDQGVFDFFDNVDILHRVHREATEIFFDQALSIRDKDLLFQETYLSDFRRTVKIFPESSFRISGLPKPEIPKVNSDKVGHVMGNVKEFRRLLHRDESHKISKDKVINSEFKGNKQAYYRSGRSKEVMEETAGSIPDTPKGFANCSEIAHCIGGLIAETDPEVNIEVLEINPAVDHTFTVVGRDPKTDIRNPLSWNKEALIVDGWLGFTAPAQEYYAKERDLHYFNKANPLTRVFTFE